MEIDLAFFAQRIAMIRCLSGFIGALLFTLVHGAVTPSLTAFRARSRTLHRIAQLRMRQQAALRVRSRG